MSNSKLLKSIIKKTLPNDVTPSFGTDPKDPWSAKANIAEQLDMSESEASVLSRYLKSRGLNPEFASKDQKIAHSKTGQFIKWKRDHMLESDTNYGPEYQDKVKSIGDKAKQGPKKTVWVPAKYGTGGQYKVVPVGDIKEYMEPMAATQSPGDGANSPDDVEPMPKGKKLITMSKSASIVKGLYKSPTIKEDAYDPEKEEKPAATMGKKPKMQKDPEDTTSGKPLAAAIMSGGKTLTGTPRDVIEIDPMVVPRRPDSEKR